jgi:membrane protein YdbS with pleckstrin-like domain
MPDVFVADQKTEEPAKIAKKVLNQKPVLDSEIIDNNSGTVHLFTSYCENPDDITFENQDEDEKVLLFIRKDFITNVSWIISGILLLLLPLIITPIAMFLHLPLLNIPQKYIIVLTIFYYLFTSTFIFISFITWYYNLNIVTEKRIIDIEFEGVVYKNVAATKLTLVQDVSYSQVGVVRTIFDYGDVLVQTAGTIDNFIFEAVPRPEDAVHVVENLIGKRNEQL